MTAAQPSDRDLELHRRFMGVIEPIRAGLLGLMEHVATLEARHDHAPADGSAAASEAAAEPSLVGPLGGQPVVTARHMGTLQLHAAADQLGALCRLVAMQETVLFADKVLTRAGIEAAARAYWLLDDRIDARGRAARGITERLHDVCQGDEMFGDEGRAGRAERRDELLAKAKAAGLDTFTPKKRAAWALEERPGATKVMMYLLDHSAEEASLGAGAQRYLSTFVHATTLGLQSAIAREEVVDLGSGQFRAELASSSADVNTLLALASLAWSTCAGSYVRYMGWADAGWRSDLLNHAALIRRQIPVQEA